MNFIKYTIWPWFKVKLIYWWWILKYGGKKNIPPQLIFERMTKSMARMNENLMNALRVSPPDMTDEEKQQLLDLIRKAGSLESEVKNLKKKDS